MRSNASILRSVHFDNVTLTDLMRRGQLILFRGFIHRRLWQEDGCVEQ